MYLHYDISHVIYWILFKIFFSFRTIGWRNVPKEGAVILASNHASYLDPPLIGNGTLRRLNYVAKEELFNRPWKRFILTLWGGIPINRDKFDKASLKRIMECIKAGKALVIFPEGTRGPDGELLPAKPGTGMLVSMAKCPVVPVYVKGSYRSLGKVHRKLHLFVPITVIYGKPMEFPEVEGEQSRDRYQRITDEIMAAIADLKREHA